MTYRGKASGTQLYGWESRRILPSGSGDDIGDIGRCDSGHLCGHIHCNSGDAVIEKVERVRAGVVESELT